MKYYEKQLSGIDDKELQDELEIVKTYRTVYVFDASQTEGKPLIEFATVQGDPKGYVEKLKDYIRDQHIFLKYGSTPIKLINLSGCEGLFYL